jgi:hypothetical protein
MDVVWGRSPEQMSGRIELLNRPLFCPNRDWMRWEKYCHKEPMRCIGRPRE